MLVDAMTTVAEAEAFAAWVALHNRNLETIYITHAHFDHFYGLSVSARPFPGPLPGDSSAQDGERHASVVLSRCGAVSPAALSRASGDQVGFA